MNERASAQKTGLSLERLARLSSVLHGYVERGEIPGMVALIHRHGEETYTETFGWQDREAQIPIQRNTLFRIMSMTKPVTTVAALMLIEDQTARCF